MGFYNRLSRSWTITKATFVLMRQDKEMLWFPILAGVFNLLFLIALAAPGTYLIMTGNLTGSSLPFYIAAFIFYFGFSFISTFFNVATVYTVAERLGGGDATVKSSLAFARSRIVVIAKWALLSASVGILLRAIEQIASRFGAIGRMIAGIATSILGLAWAIATIFVVPVLVYEKAQPFDALKKSVQVLKQTWGEATVKWLGINVVQQAIAFVGVIIFLLPAFIALFSGFVSLAIIFGLLFVLLLVLSSLIFGVADQVFNTALYTYAQTGIVPTGYSQQQLQDAVKIKK